MAAYLCRLHHIGLHVTNVDKIAYDLVAKFKFNLFAARLTEQSRQFAFRKGSAVFIVNERLNHPLHSLNGGVSSSQNSTSPQAQGLSEIYSHVFKVGDRSRNSDCRILYDVQRNYSVDTACNVCFEVKDVERSFRALRSQGCDFLVPPTNVEDDRGVVSYSVVKSIVGNVFHTLIDKTKYNGPFLPGFQEVENVTKNGARVEELSSCPITHFDHITYACPRKSTPDVMRWYEKHFGFQRFFIERNEDVNEGFVLDEEGIGLRLTAMEYWKCSESGVKLPFEDKKEPDCKFVIAESLPDQGRNQVDTFLEEHRGAGIQHVGLYTEDIVSTARSLSQAGVQFFSPPPAYYTEVGKQQEIVDAGHDPRLLSQQGILLDTDLRQDASDSLCHLTTPENKRYLLQVFTKPIFAEDTFFLELIERRGASGFGEGNIRALWRSVQAYMESEREKARTQSPENMTVQSGKS
ncbi:hypothetical protein MATL_G00016840 [Megalops atlanticus]|uniref:4-hydroxyphenylpyruvate dioxygenase n=1 Tax=Megalops atlanticus TaxID=7932 RepID=A0A9D3TLQ8_MEGAT|nr:hypothetical protein MATL_G00016840 [Megalops atlanticus]